MMLQLSGDIYQHYFEFGAAVFVNNEILGLQMIGSAWASLRMIASGAKVFEDPTVWSSLVRSSLSRQNLLFKRNTDQGYRV